MIKEILKRLAVQQELSADEVSFFINAIDQDELADAHIAAFLMGLLAKGVTQKETIAIAKLMRTHLVPVKPHIQTDLLDTCGTGGGQSTFNISTATAIVCAAAGIPVAKHGSRSLSSPSGSADVLEALGVAIDLPASALERMIEEVGIAFIHAPHFHPVMRKLLPVEMSLGIKTIFYSLIGPLISPADAKRHLLGVYREDWQPLAAVAAKELNFHRAMIAYGLDGLDEISLLGTTRIYDVTPAKTSIYEITPEDFGLQRCTIADLKSLGPQGNAQLIKAIFSGKQQGAPRDAIILNTAGALILGEKAESFHDGIRLARELLDSGVATRKLTELIDASRSFDQNAPLISVTRQRQQSRAERIWHGVLSGSPDGIVLINQDGVIEQANQHACDQLGLANTQVIGSVYAQLLIDVPDAPQRLENIARAFEQGITARWEDSLAQVIFSVTAIPIDNGTGIILASSDITEKIRAQTSEQDKRARLKTLIETLPDLIWLTDTQGKLLNCNHKFERMLGRKENELKGRHFEEFFPADITQRLYQLSSQTLHEKSQQITKEWISFANTSHREFAEIILTPFIDNQQLKGVMWIARDVTEFQRTQEQLQQQSVELRRLLYTDGLTKLPSRQAQIERIKMLANTNRSFSIIGLSLNNYSRIFSNFGSAISDAVISASVLSIREALPSNYELYHTADTRFSVIAINEVDPGVMTQLANRIIERMSKPIQIGDVSIFVNVSLGIASYPAHGADTDQLIRNTIAALNEAEQVDGMAFRLFTPHMLETVQQLQWLDHNLHLALESNQFELHYQPKVSLVDQTVTCAEALIRWQHPEKGNIRPDEFINRCETNGLIIPLGHWIIDTAARQAAEWIDQQRPIRIAINLSAAQISDSNLLEKLKAAQIRARGMLDIELTESSVMNNENKMRTLIQQCRELGFGIHMDDFGTGYSSLSVLAHLPLTMIKLDKSFVQEIGKSGNGQALLNSMISMAKELGLDIIAEGVETQVQADYLKAQGVAQVQGWLYAPAMPVIKFNQWHSS
jgi:anthranilate phosphoribosyltransferase